LPEGFDLVTTISPVDARRLGALSPRAKIEVVPNGVDRKLLDYENPASAMQGAIAFWGNLDFPPNETATRYFFDEVYEPYLAKLGVPCFVIGEGLRAGSKNSRDGFRRFRHRDLKGSAG